MPESKDNPIPKSESTNLVDAKTNLVDANDKRLEKLEKGFTQIQDENSVLQQGQAQLKEENTTLLDILHQLREENVALKAMVSSPVNETKVEEKPVLPTKTFKVNGKEYKFVLPSFHYKKETITAKDALSNKQILEDLVYRGSGVIKEVL